MNHVSPNRVSFLPDKLQQANLDIEVHKADELPETLIDQLVNKSRQPHIMEHAYNDALRRFKDKDSFYAWVASKERLLYVLINLACRSDSGEVNPDLGGVIWFGPERHELAPECDLTFAIRLYEEDKQKGWGKYVGRGLAVPFMTAAHQDLGEYYPGSRVWLDLDYDNEAAHRSYLKFGYRDLAQAGGRIVMGYTSELQADINNTDNDNENS